jgi:copper(I)-binding protein
MRTTGSRRAAPPPREEKKKEFIMKRSVLPVLVTALLATPVAWAQVSVSEAWVRSTVPQQTSSGAFMQLASPTPARLVEVRSPVAGVVEIHEMTMEGDVMRMRAVSGVDLPAGQKTELGPGGHHVMLMSLKQQLKAGDTVPLTLVFEGQDKKRQVVELRAPVRPLNMQKMPSSHEGMGHKH